MAAAAAAAASSGWLRRAAGTVPRIPCGLVTALVPTPPPPAAAVVSEAPALALPSHAAAAMELMCSARSVVNLERHELVPLGASSGRDIMAVPKKKVSKYKKGLRNGPKALKPVPVIVRCKCCGRVKLPHFYCCSGERGNPGSESS
uniref:Large ribosomal subunit protein bL32m n=1 Tax=Oryza glumipatula TaxID=40148 RepID=A0A0E0BAB8_9ORYZ